MCAVCRSYGDRQTCCVCRRPLCCDLPDEAAAPFFAPCSVSTGLLLCQICGHQLTTALETPRDAEAVLASLERRAPRF